MDNLFDLPQQAGWGVVLHGNVVEFASNAEKAIGMRPGAEEPLFTADQMQAYARAAVEAERQACAQVGFMAAINGIEVAAAIRERGKS